MEELPSVSEDSNCKPTSSNEQPGSQSKIGKKPIVLKSGDIDGLLECLVCSNSMFPPIQQCPSGHTLCNSCRNKVNNKCPICRKEIGNIRCLALEKFAVVLHLPCTYHHYGCSEMFPYYNKLQHEAQCIFKPYLCPHPGSNCPFSGDIPALLSHLQETHKVDLQAGCTFNHRYVKQDPCSVDNLAWTLTLFNCFGYYFCLHFEAFLLGREPMYMAFVRFIGEESEARKFSYCLEVGGNGRKLTWQGVPRSIRTHHRAVRDSHDGLVLQRSLALYFSGGDRKELKLRVSGRIWREIGAIKRIN
ncbi:E3 ubiquitin-protein ligase SINAT2-like [Ananas comosus]|uniref:RING-type E3 ubiquitin transferase n=1 Tax=Ananas comosus TaxID=4615 RepID=A0A6P5EL25_ANACO|nr:E3 ubiquitin-protein ligase SINAT2-like [Ananas comosus]XP_020082072.1 E3 ubiquitin-protein ligase SINAT2-like [Ananas comosus]XP_020082074.1 E3 ubiquitin-protein ligase SINAT2-like [Ananas comosus]XP_020082075.1 E3 ubiquitin-protein ligase SINAT2-like [Ananas comosus]XP_020082076.1 E3 ubiquitin-protein ligase SINAT2-like [Ananas comosus]XP_020082077.1 E3 ubiquitin-protein ligase SINAT2-like [Ananas comosus]XP_020083629.1 E3 ubiquitin-protein ligase SINAT2-like [Ananas comosus]XP_02008363